MVAALGAIPKDETGDDFRIIHDGTHYVHVNDKIRLRDHVRLPRAADLLGLAREVGVYAHLPRFALAHDVKHAHRLIPVAEEDQGLQACQIDGDADHVWVNRVGTFGIRSASYWWGRTMAAAVRVKHTSSAGRPRTSP